MTLEQKVAQLVCTDISGAYLPEDDPKFQSWLQLAREGVGGFVLYGGTPAEVTRLLNRLQKEAAVPLLMSCDFEGGPGQQVTGASEFPGHQAFAAVGDTGLMYRAARIMGEEGLAMGIHLTYSPVTDVSTIAGNPQESVRSLGSNIDLNGQLLRAYVRGIHDAGMLCTAKHFPGRGNQVAFKDFPGFNYLPASAESLEQNEFKAFKYAVDAGVDFIMTEHLAVPAVTGGSPLPASMEPKLATGIIRDKLGFKGILTTDDLFYPHVVARFGAEEAAVKAMEAGHDIVLKPKDPIATIEAIAAAVRSGRISEERINTSVMKLLTLKARLGLDKNRYTDPEKVNQLVGTVAHQQVVQEVADRSVTLMRNEGLLPLKAIDPKNTVHITIQKEDNQLGVQDAILKMTAAFPGMVTFSLKPGCGAEYFRQAEAACQKAGLVILSFFVQRTRFGDAAPVPADQLKLVNGLIASKPGKVIALSYGNPYILAKIPNVTAFLLGYGERGWYGNQLVYTESFIRVLQGNLEPRGNLPLK
jgi:beta-N-acetylhexosaminidase